MSSLGAQQAQRAPGVVGVSVTILHGDCKAVLRTLPERSVHTCVTSPPYWGLRSYLPDDHPDKHKEIGLEESVHTWVEEMVAVFREVRRVLRDDGTLWLNLGDSYAANRAYQVPSTKGGPKHSESQAAGGKGSAVPDGLKPKDLIGQPWRVAFALQADGWWLRQDIVWAKANPMPESVRDRCTKAHEYVFLLAKSERYYYDFEAMQEPVSGGAHARLPGNKTHKHTAEYDATGDARHRTKAGLVAYAERMHNSAAARNARANPDAKNALGEMVNGMRTVGVGHNKRPRKAVPNVGRRQGPPGNAAEALALQGPKAQLDANDSAYGAGKSARMGRGAGWRNKHNESFDEAMAVMPATRNKRSVWTVGTEPFSEAHFATFPPALIEPCILAGCPENVCTNCGGPLDEQSLKELRDVRRADHDGSAGPSEALLQQGVRVPLHSEEQSHNEGLHDHQPRLPCDLSADAPISDGGRLRAGAPLGDGAGAGPPAAEDRGCASQERDPAGQPAGEPGGDDESRARPPAKAGSAPDRVPTLRRAHRQLSPRCPRCGADLQTQGAVGPGTVLDCFFGAGTTGLVADRLQRDCIGIELNPAYIDIARRRIAGDAPLFAEVAHA